MSQSVFVLGSLAPRIDFEGKKYQAPLGESVLESQILPFEGLQNLIQTGSQPIINYYIRKVDTWLGGVSPILLFSVKTILFIGFFYYLYYENTRTWYR